TPHSPLPASTPKPKASVILCQKSSCRKRGAAEVHQAVIESLGDRGLGEQVAIKDTGCMKQCKYGPCMVFMPDKSRYTEVRAKDVPMLVEKHFASKLKPEAREPQLSGVH
ncbi:MAG TPA: NADH:ubiquinone oxidoreductase, partial [Cyanobacteria bacterium UBA11148]|nr:NADH:ubiquinone oxidoreductase [Cyanobacteria bacterium UBA11148]